MQQDITITNPRTLSNKDVTTNGKVEFLSRYLVIEDKETIPIIGYIYVDEDTVCRLDLVVKYYYGTTDELDIFLRFNNIDDMFAVPIGAKLLIPDKFALISRCKFVSTKTEYSLDANKLKNNENKETITQTRTKLQNRGVGFTVVAPGVLKF